MRLRIVFGLALISALVFAAQAPAFGLFKGRCGGGRSHGCQGGNATSYGYGCGGGYAYGGGHAYQAGWNGTVYADSGMYSAPSYTSDGYRMMPGVNQAGYVPYTTGFNGNATNSVYWDGRQWMPSNPSGTIVYQGGFSTYPQSYVQPGPYRGNVGASGTIQGSATPPGNIPNIGTGAGINAGTGTSPGVRAGGSVGAGTTPPGK